MTTPSWLVTAGGRDQDQVAGLAAAEGSIALVGSYRGDGIDLGIGPVPAFGETDMLVARLQAADGTATWTWGLGGATDDLVSGVAVLTGGDVMAGGRFSSPQSFGGTTSHTVQGTFDGFVERFRSDGMPLWASDSEGGALVGIEGIAADPAAGVFVIGLYNGTIENPARLGGGTAEFASRGGIDVFVARYHVNGGALAVRDFGGPMPDYIHGITVAAGNVVAVGEFAGELQGLGIAPAAVGYDALVVTLVASDLAAPAMVRTFGGAGIDRALAVDHGPVGARSAALAVGGSTQGTVVFGACASCRPPAGGMRDGYVVRFASAEALAEPLWVRRFGTDGTTEIVALVHGSEELYIAGTFDGSVQFDDGTIVTSAGGVDTFLARVSALDGRATLVATLAGPGEDVIDRLALDGDHLVFAGRFEPGAELGGARPISAGAADLIVGAYVLR